MQPTRRQTPGPTVGKFRASPWQAEAPSSLTHRWRYYLARWRIFTVECNPIATSSRVAAPGSIDPDDFAAQWACRYTTLQDEGLTVSCMQSCGKIIHGSTDPGDSASRALLLPKLSTAISHLSFYQKWTLPTVNCSVALTQHCQSPILLPKLSTAISQLRCTWNLALPGTHSVAEP